MGEGWERPEAERELLPQLCERVKGRVGYEDAQLSVRQLEKLEDEAPDGVELVPAGDLVEQLRAVKDDHEIEAIAAAAELADEVYGWAIGEGLAGRTELEVARAAEARIRELGAEPSFPPIVAAGRKRRAAPRRARRARRSAPGSWWSSTWAPSSTATARTAPAPSPRASPSDEAREVYELVRRRPGGRARGGRPGPRRQGGGRRRPRADRRRRPRRALRPRPRARRRARGPRGAAPLGRAPRTSCAPATWSRSSPVSTSRAVLGVRIEDLVVVTEQGHRNLSGRPKQLEIVD